MDTIEKKLLSYQVSHYKNLIYSLTTYGRVLDASDTGTGKTFTAIATAKHLNLKPLIICPKSVLSNWEKVLNEFNCDYYGLSNYESFSNCKMYTKMSKDEKVYCKWLHRTSRASEDRTSRASEDQVSEANERKTTEGKFEWKNPPSDILLIFDESHRCKNSTTISFNILYTIAKIPSSKILLLSATVADKEENFGITGFVLGLYDNIRNSKRWIYEHGKNFENPMIGVHSVIIPEYMSRMKIKELGDLFPKNKIVADCYDMDTKKEIQTQYKLIEEETEMLQEKEQKSSCYLAQIQYARMRIEQLRIPTFIELAKKFLEEKNNVVIFVNYSKTLKVLADEFNTNCVIYGEQSLETRENNIKDFNEDKEKLIIVNIRSGGVGISLHDTIGNFPRVSIISPCWSAQDTIQAFGRICRAKTKTPVRQYLVYCKGTIEEEVCEKMVDKIKNISAINSGDIDEYRIEGLIEESGTVNPREELTEFETNNLKAYTLQEKIKRLYNDIINTKDEIKEIERNMYKIHKTQDEYEEYKKYFSEYPENKYTVKFHNNAIDKRPNQ